MRESTRNMHDQEGSNICNIDRVYENPQEKKSTKLAKNMDTNSQEKQ